MKKFTVTPWEVKGDVDYDKLLRDFGLQPLSKMPKQFNELPLFRRGIVFAHRDFHRIAEAIEKKKPFVMITGLMPSGSFHFGHKVLVDQIVLYQKLGAKVYVPVADIEAYLSRQQNLSELRDIAINEYLTNYVALGLDLKKCDFYFQSNRSPDGKKASAYYRLSQLLARHATFSEFKAVYGEITPGKITASLLQAADILHAQLPEFEGKPLPVVVPVGIDQDAHLRLTRDLSHRIKEHPFMQISSTYHTFMPGLKEEKMSSSNPLSFVALTDSPETATMKIKKYAFSGGQASLEEHRKKGGNPDVDVAYQMLRYGLEPDDGKLKRIHDDYRAGKLLSGELKEITIGKISQFLKEHQEKRKAAKAKVEQFVKDQGL